MNSRFAYRSSSSPNRRSAGSREARQARQDRWRRSFPKFSLSKWRELSIVRGVCDAFRQSTARSGSSTRFAGLGLTSECLEAKICLTADVVAVADVFSAQTEDNVQNIPDLPGGLLANDTVDGVPFNGSNLVITGVSNSGGDQGAPVDEGFTITSDLGADVLVRPDGSFVYNPLGSDFLQSLGENEGATDSFSYTVSDVNGMDSETTTVTFSITGVDDAPIANPDDAVAVLDDPAGILIDVLANDSDPEGNSLTLAEPVASIPTALGGTAIIEGGLIRYVAPDSMSASEGDVDTFSYTVSDGAITNTATVSVTLALPPVANPDDVSTGENSVLSDNVLDNDILGDMPGDVSVTSFDVDLAGDPPPALDFDVALPLAAGGELTISADGSFTFDPLSDFDDLADGESVAIPVEYTITDSGSNRTSTSTATITVLGVNDGPVATVDPLDVSGNEDTEFSVNVIDENVTDVDTNDVLTATPFSTTFSDGDGDIATVDVAEDGTLTVTPIRPNFNGSLGSVSVTVTDPSGETADFMVDITIDSVNDPPVAADQSFPEMGTFDEDSGSFMGTLVATDADIEAGESQTLTFLKSSDPSNGTVIVSSDGTFEYTPNANFNGTDSFTFLVQDSEGGFDVSTTATITVSAVNDDPTAVPESLTIDLADLAITGDDAAAASIIDGVLVVDVLGNDEDIDLTVGEFMDELSLDAVDSGDATAELTVDGDPPVTSPSAPPSGIFSGNFAVGIPLDAVELSSLTDGESLEVDIVYTIRDLADSTSTATLTVTFVGVNDPPVVVDDEFTLDINDVSRTIDIATELLDDDSDPEMAGPLTFVSFTPAGNGTVVADDAMSPTTLTYTPNGIGVDTFTYTVADVDGNESTGTVTVTTFDPDAGLDTFSGLEDETITIEVADLLANDADLGLSGTLSFVDVVSTSNGTVTMLDSDTLEFTPFPNVNDFLNPGDIGFSYDVMGDEGVATANVVISLTPQNDAAGIQTGDTLGDVFEGDAVDLTLGDAINALEDGGPVVTGVLAANNAVEIDGDVINITRVDVDGSAGVSWVEIAPGETVAVFNAVSIDNVDPGDVPSTQVGELTLNADGTLSFSTAGFLQELPFAGLANLLLDYEFTDTPVADGVDMMGDPVIDDATTAEGTIEVVVDGSNDAPVVDDLNTAESRETILENSTFSVDVSGVSSDVDGDFLRVSSAGVFVDGSLIGTLPIPADSLTFDFSPSDFDEFNLLDVGETLDGFILYTVEDFDGFVPIGLDDTGMFYFTIDGENDDLEAIDDGFSTDSSTALSDNVLTNDRDDLSDLPLSTISAGATMNAPLVDGSLTFAADGGGMVTINSDGSFTFDPNGDFDDLEVGGADGTASFVYEAENADGDTDTATVTITVVAVDDAPTGTVADVQVFENGDGGMEPNQTGPLDGELLTSIVDPDPEDRVDGVNDDMMTITTPDNPGISITAVNGDGNLVDQAIQFNGGELTVGADGTVTFNSQGAFESLGEGASQSFDFTFTVSEFDQLLDGDGNAVVVDDELQYVEGLSTEFTTTLVVNGENDAPVGDDDAFLFGVPETAMVGASFPIPVGDLLANDSDIDVGDLLSVTATLNASSELVGAPLVFGDIDGDMPGDEGYSPEFFVNVMLGTLPMTGGEPVTASFEYLVADDAGSSLSDVATVNLTFTSEGLALDDPGTGDPITTPEDTPILIDVLANDVNGSMGGLTINNAVVTGGDSVGTVSIDDSAGFDQLLFTPAENFNGSGVTIEYFVNDDADSAIVTLTVTPVNDAPVAADDAATVTEDDLLFDLDLQDNDPADIDGDTVTVTQINGADVMLGVPVPVAGGGTVTFDGSSFLFSTDGDFQDLQVGDAVDVSFTYTITDDGQSGDPLEDDFKSATATATITVTGLNDAPVVVSDFADVSVDEQTPFDFTTLDLSGVATDIDNAIGELSVTGVSLVDDDLPAGDPGTFDGSGLIFTPSGDDGFDTLLFEVTISDPIGASDVALITMNVDQVNQEPGLMDFDFTITEDEDRLIDLVDDLNGIDDDGEEVTITAINGMSIASEQTITLPSGATVTLNADGDLFYETNGAFDFLRDLSGPIEETFTDLFTVTGTDGVAPVTVDVSATITGVNDPPTAVDDSATTSVGVPVVIDVLANDIDPDGGESFISGIGFSASTNGSVSVNPDGTVTYTPNPGFDGTAMFTYTVSDGFSGGTDIGTVTVEVEPVNTAPPEVLAVRFGSQDFADGFLTEVDAAGIGVVVAEDVGAGLVETGEVLPYINLDRLFVTFSEPVTGVAGAVELNGVNVPSYGLSLVGVEGSTAEFAIDRTLTADRLNVVVDGTMVVDSSGDSGSLESVDVNVLPADVNGDTLVNVQDIALIGIGTASAYDPNLDINGSGLVTNTDVILANLLQFTSLPEAAAASSLAVAEADDAGLGALAISSDDESEEEESDVDQAFDALSGSSLLLIENEAGRAEGEGVELADNDDEVDGADEAFAELADVVDFSM